MQLDDWQSKVLKAVDADSRHIYVGLIGSRDISALVSHLTQLNYRTWYADDSRTNVSVHHRLLIVSSSTVDFKMLAILAKRARLVVLTGESVPPLNEKTWHSYDLEAK